MDEIYNNIPTWDNGKWTVTDFESRELFSDFIFGLFKEPGKYEFDEGALMFNEEARKFKENGEVYCLAPYMSKDFINYWNDKKEKCRKGVIFKNGEKSFRSRFKGELS